MREVDLRNLVRLGGVNSLSACPLFGGYVLRVETPKGEETLTLQRGGDRVFKTLDAVASVVASVGIERFNVLLPSPMDVHTHQAALCAEGPRLRGDCTGAAVGMSDRDKAKADPKRAKARANRKKRR